MGFACGLYGECVWAELQAGLSPHLSFSQHLCTSLKEKKAGAREGTPHGSQAPWLPETAGAAEPEQLALELQELPVCPGSTLTPL